MGTIESKKLVSGQRLSIEEYRKIMKLTKDDSSSVDKPNKYHNKITYVDGIRFDSCWEARRYSELIILQMAGEIASLELQVPYQLIINGTNIATYVADFTYHAKGKLVVEDAKGFETAEYKMKKKLMLAIHNIAIHETREKKKARKAGWNKKQKKKN